MRASTATPHDSYSGIIVDGRYKLLEEVGRGNIGRVYRAVQLRVNRDVAVKILRRDLVFDNRMSERFEREARAIARLDHSNCLTLHDFGYDEDLGSLFMVTELLEGSTLAALSDELDEMSRLQVGYYIAEALMHAHAAGVVHRDLKPENVMACFDLDGRLRVKVVDFGLALLRDRGDITGERRRLTLTGEIQGSPRYLSPEQCRGALETTAASDMYSLGVILYELFEGDVPFSGPSVPAVLTGHVSDPPPPMQSFPVIDVEQLIYELLAKEPDLRPTAHEARDVFARNIDLTGSGVHAPPHGLAETTLDSGAFETAAAPPAGITPVEPAETSSELELLVASPEARVGVVVGVLGTLLLLLTLGLGWLLLQ